MGAWWWWWVVPPPCRWHPPVDDAFALSTTRGGGRLIKQWVIWYWSKYYLLNFFAIGGGGGVALLLSLFLLLLLSSSLSPIPLSILRRGFPHLCPVPNRCHPHFSPARTSPPETTRDGRPTASVTSRLAPLPPISSPLPCTGWPSPAIWLYQSPSIGDIPNPEGRTGLDGTASGIA